MENQENPIYPTRGAKAILQDETTGCEELPEEKGLIKKELISSRDIENKTQRERSISLILYGFLLFFAGMILGMILGVNSACT